MDSIIVAVVLCQLHIQAVDEYILDNQPINSEQISDSCCLSSLTATSSRKGLCLVDSTSFV